MKEGGSEGARGSKKLIIVSLNSRLIPKKTIVILPFDGVSTDLFSVDLSTSWMPENCSERSSTNVLRHLDHVVERHVRLPVRTVASHRDGYVFTISTNLIQSKSEYSRDLNTGHSNKVIQITVHKIVVHRCLRWYFRSLSSELHK